MDMGIGRASIMVMVMVRGRDWTSISYKREIPQSTLPSAGQPDTAGRRWHPALHTTPCHRLRILPGWDGSHPLARSAARAHRPSCATLRLLQSTKEEGLLHCTEIRPPHPPPNAHSTFKLTATLSEDYDDLHKVVRAITAYNLHLLGAVFKILLLFFKIWNI